MNEIDGGWEDGEVPEREENNGERVEEKIWGSSTVARWRRGVGEGEWVKGEGEVGLPVFLNRSRELQLGVGLVAGGVGGAELVLGLPDGGQPPSSLLQLLLNPQHFRSGTKPYKLISYFNLLKPNASSFVMLLSFKF